MIQYQHWMLNLLIYSELNCKTCCQTGKNFPITLKEHVKAMESWKRNNIQNSRYQFATYIANKGLKKQWSTFLLKSITDFESSYNSIIWYWVQNNFSKLSVVLFHCLPSLWFIFWITKTDDEGKSSKLVSIPLNFCIETYIHFISLWLNQSQHGLNNANFN